MARVMVFNLVKKWDRLRPSMSCMALVAQVLTVAVDIVDLGEALARAWHLEHYAQCNISTDRCCANDHWVCLDGC